MDLFFNELSIAGKETLSRDSAVVFSEIYRALKKYGITTCRIASEDNLKLYQMIQNMPDFLNIRNFYFSFFRSPYESDEVENEQEEYFEHEWLYDGKPCMGLSLAIILNTAALSIYETEWKEAYVHITKDNTVSTARNVSIERHVEIHIPQIQPEGEPELVKSDLPIEAKEISLRDDHGKDVLTNFAKRLRRCPYVVGIVNSLPFNSRERRFIRKIRDGGLIEIVLPWTDEGYGIVVKTTGRTMKETEKIGRIISDEYGGV